MSVYPILDCNWLQSMENSVDPAHLQILHQDTASRGHTAKSTTRGLIDLVEKVEFEELPFGILKKRYFTDGTLDQHPLIFPNNLRARNSTQFRVPIDDTHTWHVHILFSPTEDGSIVEQGDDIPVQYYEPFKYPEGGQYPDVTYTMHIALAQDQMTWETAGPIADRERERLATSDQGIVMYREMLKREIRKVQQGLDPMGVIRDPAHPVIDTGFSENLETAVYREIYRVADQDRGGVGAGERPTYQRYETAPSPRASD